jgi:tetratricopeptide (TPR) repeat protein
LLEEACLMAADHGDVVVDAEAVRTAADLALVLRALRRREARLRNGPELTYREIADRTGWSVSVIGGYFTGVKLPSTERFDELVRLLGARPPEQGVLASAWERAEAGRTGAVRAGGGARAAPVPRMLPPRAAGFAGRLSALAQLDALLVADSWSGAVVISAVDGMAGVGKTALAVHWAHAAAGSFPDGQLYVNLRGYDPSEPLSTMDAFGVLLGGLGLEPASMSRDLPGRVAQYHRLLAGRRMLVLLDNASGPEHARLLLPPPPSVAVVTSRDDLVELATVDGARRVRLDVLPEDEAVALLRLLVGERADREPDAARALARRCGHLPLALRVAAEHAAFRPAVALADLVVELDDASSRLDVLGAPGDDRTDLRVVFSWSLSRLPAPAARAFRLLGLVPGNDVDVYGVAALVGVDRPGAQRLVEMLLRAHLIQSDGHGRYSMHDLLWAYARAVVEQGVPPGERRSATGRLLDHYLTTATAAVDIQFPGLKPARRRNRPRPVWPTQSPELDGGRVAAAWLDAERDNLVRACAQAAASGWPSHAVALALALRPALQNGHDQEGLSMLGEALRVAGVMGTACDPLDVADLHVGLAFTNWHLGRIEVAAAHGQRALDEHTRLEWAQGIIYSLAVLGGIRYSQGRLAEAVDCERRGLAVARGAANRAQEANQLNNLGWLHLRLDEHEAAAHCYHQGVLLNEEIGQIAGVAMCRAGLAAAYAGLGRYDEALALAEQSLVVEFEYDRLHQRVETTTTIGNIYRLQGGYADAVEQHTAALAMGSNLDNFALTSFVLNNLGDAHLAAGDHASATDSYRRALEFADKGGDRFERTRALAGLGDARHCAGEAARAREHWQQAYHSYVEMGLPAAERVRARLAGKV